MRHISRYTPLTGTKAAREELANARAKLAALMLLSLRGTPFLYYGEEIGMREEAVPRRHHKDPVALKYWPFHPGRDGCRRPMAWTGNEKQGGGFTTADGTTPAEDTPSLTKGPTPWLPLSNNLKRINVEDQTKDPTSMLAFYKKCIWFRRQDEILRCGNQHMLGVDGSESGNNQVPKGILAYVREFKGGKRLILLNFMNKKVTVPLFHDGYFADAAGFQVVLSTQEDRPVANSVDDTASNAGDSLIKGDSITLNANEGMILRVWSKRRFNQ